MPAGGGDDAAGEEFTFPCPVGEKGERAVLISPDQKLIAVSTLLPLTLALSPQAGRGDYGVCHLSFSLLAGRRCPKGG